MATPHAGKELSVWMNGEFVGRWRITRSGHHELHYADSWLADGRPLSLSMPLRAPESPYKGQLVESFFDNFLPENPEIRRRIKSQFNAPSTNAFDLLSEIGRDCAGAVQLLPPDEQPDNLRRIVGKRLDDEAIAKHLRDTVSTPLPGQNDREGYRISIAGMQEKTALLWHRRRWHLPRSSTPTTHIFKLPLGRVGQTQIDLSQSVENEWLCAQIVAAYGFATPDCEIAQFDDQRVLIVERFDRRLAQDGKWWIRLPQEDMCQATGTPPGQKYESDGGPGIGRIMDLLYGARNAHADRRKFFKLQILYWMLCAIDGHAKNFSVFIEPGGAYSLTPSYDVLSAYPILGHGANKLAPERAKMAMAVSGNNRHYHWAKILPRHWQATAKASNVEKVMKSMVAELVDSTSGVIDHVGGQLPPDFPASVSEPIFCGLKKAACDLRNWQAQ